MDDQYQMYCLTHPFFYDSPQLSTSRKFFPAARRPLPRGWRRVPSGDWINFVAPDSEMAGQGWKIHVSACEENAPEILTRVWEYCVPRGITFKIVGGPVDLRMRNTKYADRSASGKAATIYPADEAACERILAELDAEIGGAPGPYILSDLRYGDGPLYVRYGGFLPRYCLDSRGEFVPAIENASGDLVPDVRSPVFTVPDWVSLPDFLAPHLSRRNSVAMADLDYEITGALHFSNGGGVYTATRKRDGRKVILKEARPHAGLAGDGSDSVSRLHREHEFMRRLTGLGIAPEAYEIFEAGGHHFLAEEYVDGPLLSSEFARRYPLFRPDPDPDEVSGYTEWVLRICASAERAVALMHSRGVVFNDLHLRNIIVRPDDTVAFIDFEAAADESEERRLTIGDHGFVAPPDREGADADLYSLACVKLALFMPMTSVLSLDRSRVTQLTAAIASVYPVPVNFLSEAVTEIGRGGPEPARPGYSALHEFAEAADAAESRAGAPAAGGAIPRPRRAAEEPAAWSRLKADLTATIRASASPERTDRLFPGDIGQFSGAGGGLGLAYGAAGVLYALDEAAGIRVPEYEEWLLRQVKRPPELTPIGLWDGLSGAAWTLARLGHRDAAVRLAEVCLAGKWEKLGPSLFGGIAGLGLAMLDLAETAAEPSLAAAGLRAAEIVADSGADGLERAGLMRGASGQALLCVRAYEHTADPSYLDAAETAVRADLGRCAGDAWGGLQVDEGWRIMPYLADGSAGVGMVIDRLLEHRPDPDLADAADRIALAASSVFYVFPGLLGGRAGLLCFLASRDQASRRVRDHVRRLAWHAVPCASGLAFPGEQLLRFSMDLGTGNAGVLLGLASALAPGGATVPGLARPAHLPGGNSARGAGNTHQLASR